MVPASTSQQPGDIATSEDSSARSPVASMEASGSAAQTNNSQSLQTTSGSPPSTISADTADTSDEFAADQVSADPDSPKPHLLRHSAEEIGDDAAPESSNATPTNATPTDTLPVSPDDEETPVVPPPRSPSPRKKVVPTRSEEEEEEEEEEVAPTRLLRSAVKKAASGRDEEEGEGLVVSWSLELVRSSHEGSEGESKGIYDLAYTAD